MRKQARLPEPAFLEAHKQDWTARWIERAANGARFSWPTLNKVTVNRPLSELLRQQTLEHCSFCDGHPVRSLSPETIEHFRPKEKNAFPELAFSWDNLFYCCQRCQNTKLNSFDDLLIKPDSIEYEFSDFFYCDYTSGEIVPNLTSSQINQERAEITIRIYGFNLDPLPAIRRQWLIRWNDSAVKNLDDFPYRDYILGA